MDTLLYTMRGKPHPIGVCSALLWICLSAQESEYKAAVLADLPFGSDIRFAQHLPSCLIRNPRISFTRVLTLPVAGSHLHPEPVAGLRHHGQEEGIHDPREEEEAEDSPPQEGRRGAEEGAGAQGRGEAPRHRREVRGEWSTFTSGHSSYFYTEMKLQLVSAKYVNVLPLSSALSFDI